MEKKCIVRIKMDNIKNTKLTLEYKGDDYDEKLNALFKFIIILPFSLLCLTALSSKILINFFISSLLHSKLIFSSIILLI